MFFKYLTMMLLKKKKSSCEIIKLAGWNKQGHCVQPSNLFLGHAIPMSLCLDHMRVIWNCGGNSGVV